jgi:membrane protein DedA with SNARE-associated domain
MNDRFIAPLTGFVTSLISFEIWQNILLSFVVAFVGGIAAWLGRLVCETVKKKIASKTKNKNS